MTYTPKIIEFLIRHWNVDVSGTRLAQLLGVDYGALRMAVHRLKAKGHPFVTTEPKPVGHQFTYRRKTGGACTRVKTESGYKYVRVSEKHHARRVPIGAITIRQRYGVAWRFQRTETGWASLGRVTPLEKRERKARATKPRAPRVKKPKPLPPPATKGRNPTRHTRSRNPVINCKNPDEIKIRKQEEGGRWVYDPAKRGWVYRKDVAA